MTRYRVDLEELLEFVETLRGFEQKAEAIAGRVDSQIADLHTSWSGDAATAHRANHDEWTSAAAQMREALSQLRETAHNAHRNYSEAVKANITMLS